MSNTLAFVYYPHNPNQGRLETMPFALNPIIRLAKAGWMIDLYLWEAVSSVYQEVLPNNVKIKYFPEFLGNRWFRRGWLMWLSLNFMTPHSYRCVFGVGQIGVYFARLLAKSSSCPFIYMNDEFPSSWHGWHNTQWWSIEKWAVKDAAMVITPDIQRFDHLCQELNIPPTTPHATWPNMPLIKHASLLQIDWHAELKIPEQTVPFLHAGSVGDWVQIPELLSTVPYWPQRASLVIHSRYWGTAEEEYRRKLSHLEFQDRVIWSTRPIPPDQLNSLVAYCAGNFALYRNTGPNIEYMGLSSGKIMRSLAVGSPVIATNFHSLSFIEKHKIGVLIKHPVEIVQAVERILANRAAYSKRCLEFCKHDASFENAWDTFCMHLYEVSKVKLDSPF